VRQGKQLRCRPRRALSGCDRARTVATVTWGARLRRRSAAPAPPGYDPITSSCRHLAPASPTLRLVIPGHCHTQLEGIELALRAAGPLLRDTGSEFAPSERHPSFGSN